MFRYVWLITFLLIMLGVSVTNANAAPPDKPVLTETTVIFFKGGHSPFGGPKHFLGEMENIHGIPACGHFSISKDLLLLFEVCRLEGSFNPTLPPLRSRIATSYFEALFKIIISPKGP